MIFDSSDPRLNQIVSAYRQSSEPVAGSVVEPLRLIASMTCSPDDDVQRRQIEAFDWSHDWHAPAGRWRDGLPWVEAVGEYALYRGERSFLASCVPGVRAVMERWRGEIDDRGMVAAPEHASGAAQWALVYALERMARLDELMNEPLLAQRNRQTAAALAARGEAAFFDASRGLLADDASRRSFAPHTQALAIAGGHLSQCLHEPVGRAISESQLDDASAAEVHHALEALRQVGRIDRLIERLAEPSPHQQDAAVCHCFASVLGIRPSALGFNTVMVAPQLGPLDFARGEMAHPRGTIRVEFHRQGDALRGRIELPEAVTGRLTEGPAWRALVPGLNVL